jgi:hypothetical protein
MEVGGAKPITDGGKGSGEVAGGVRRALWPLLPHEAVPGWSKLSLSPVTSEPNWA